MAATELPPSVSGLVQFASDVVIVVTERHQSGALEAAQHRAARLLGQAGLSRGFIGPQFLADAHSHQQLFETIERVVGSETRRFHVLRPGISLQNGATDMPALARRSERISDAIQDTPCILYTPAAPDGCAKILIIKS